MLTNIEAAAFRAMDKHAIDQTPHDFPSLGGQIAVPLQSYDKREAFILDVQRGRIDLAKVTHQNRARVCVVLMRLDIGGPMHTNPDGTEMPCPHLHIYDEQYGTRFAHPVPEEVFSDLSNLSQTLDDFMALCFM